MDVSNANAEALSFKHWIDDAVTRFDAEFRTDHQVIDHDHRGLLQLGFAINDALLKSEPPETIKELLTKFGACVIDHFAHEESEMLKAGYPDYLGHRMEHERLSHAWGQLADEFGSGRLRTPGNLHHFIKNLVLCHIARTDRTMVQWLHQRQGSLNGLGSQPGPVSLGNASKGSSSIGQPSR